MKFLIALIVLFTCTTAFADGGPCANPSHHAGKTVMLTNAPRTGEVIECFVEDGVDTYRIYNARRGVFTAPAKNVATYENLNEKPALEIDGLKALDSLDGDLGLVLSDR